MAADFLVSVCRRPSVQRSRKNPADGDFNHFALARAPGSKARGRPRWPRRECLLPLLHAVPFFGGHPCQQRRRHVFWRAMRFDFLGAVAVSLAPFRRPGLGAGAGGGAGLQLSRTARHRRVAANPRRLQCPMACAFHAAKNRPAAKLDRHRPDRVFETVRQNCHPSPDQKRQAAAGLSARGLLSHLFFPKTKLVCGQPADRFRSRFTRTRPDDLGAAAGKNQPGICQHRLRPQRRKIAAATADGQRAARKSERLHS